MYISKPQLLDCSSKQEIVGTYLLFSINFFFSTILQVAMKLCDTISQFGVSHDIKDNCQI